VVKAFPWVVVIVFTGCVSPLKNLRDERLLELDGARFVVKSNGQPRDVARIERALQRAPKEVERWGLLRLPVTVFVVPNHAELETAVGRRGYEWLRAWARFDEVIFQAPSTWAPGAEILEELVVHELTHCLLFQSTGEPDTWEALHIPLWFREGMALSTARQHRRYPSLEDSARWLEAHPELDPFGDGDRLSNVWPVELYGVAVHTFDHLVERYSDEAVKRLMSVMRGGKDFEPAFTEAVGLSPRDFEQQVRGYLKARRFREKKRSVPSLEERLDQTRSSTQGRSETTPGQ